MQDTQPNTHASSPRPPKLAQRAKNLQHAQQLLEAYQRGDPQALKTFKSRHPQGQESDFCPTLLDARLLIASNTTRVPSLSLEKLKKEAKDLLKQIKAASPDALERLTTYYAKDNKMLKLADAQYIIARENGLASWPKLKAHIASINQSKDLIQQLSKQSAKQPSKQQTSLDSDLTTLHIRCGDDIKKTLPLCGLNGDFFAITNPFSQGPVPHFEPPEAFITTRDQFLQQHFVGLIPEEYIDQSKDETRTTETTLRDLPGNYQRIVLWFEHDPFDQLCLSYILAHFAELNLQHTTIECVQTHGFPGVDKFIGIGQLCRKPEALLLLWQQRTQLTPAMTAFGARCWHAFTTNNPTKLWQLSEENYSPLPYMQPSIKRILQELPWQENGLTLTETLALEILERDGPMTADKLFYLLMTESDPLPYLGDIMFYTILRPFWQAKDAAITLTDYDAQKPPMQKHTLAISQTGRALLNGEQHWLKAKQDAAIKGKWLGGIHIQAGKTNWYWSEEHNKPILK